MFRAAWAAHTREGSKNIPMLYCLVTCAVAVYWSRAHQVGYRSLSMIYVFTQKEPSHLQKHGWRRMGTTIRAVSAGFDRGIGDSVLRSDQLTVFDHLIWTSQPTASTTWARGLWVDLKFPFFSAASNPKLITSLHGGRNGPLQFILGTQCSRHKFTVFYSCVLSTGNRWVAAHTPSSIGVGAIKVGAFSMNGKGHHQTLCFEMRII